jgi:hypothetical protein
MKIYISASSEGKVLGWSSTRGSDLEVEVEISDDHPFLTENHTLYVVDQGTLIKNTDLALEKAKNAKKIELDQDCHNTIMGRFEVDIGGTIYEFSCDLEAQSNFARADRAFEKGRITTTGWTAYINGEVTRVVLDEPTFEAVYTAHLYHITDNISKFRDVLEPKVNNATRVEEVMSVKWVEGGEATSKL